MPDMVVRLSGLLSRIITLSAGVGAIFPAKCQQGVRSWLVETKEPLLQDICGLQHDLPPHPTRTLPTSRGLPQALHRKYCGLHQAFHHQCKKHLQLCFHCVLQYDLPSYPTRTRPRTSFPLP